MTPSAEEGGNQPLRTLLVGGTKHGQFINLPEDDKEYEFVESTILSGVGYSANDPRYVPSIYLYDEALTGTLGSKSVADQVFVHRTLRVANFSTLDRDLADSLDEQKRLGDRVIELSADLTSASEIIEESNDRLDEYANIIEEFKARSIEARRSLEMLLNSARHIGSALGTPYVEMFGELRQEAGGEV